MNRTLLIFLLSLLLLPGLRAQFPVRVQVNVVQPVPPYLPQIKADIAGNRSGLLNQDISSHLSIILSYTGRAQAHIKLSGSIQRVAPSPLGVSVRPDYQPAQPIIMGPQQPILSLTRDMLQSAFGNFSENSLVYTNMDLGTLRQNLVDFKLPEGTYRVCVTAYDYDKAGLSAPLSAPGTGCAFFTICYTASAPQLILPVSTMLQSNSGFQDFTPHSPQVQFIWTPPATTCGMPVGALNYDLEIRRVFEGQTVTDAQSNPYAFHQQNIPTTTFLLDTLKYAHVLVPGQKYTVRVKANFMAMPGSPLEIANQGYSQVGAFTYQPINNIPGNGLAVNQAKDTTPPIPPGSTIIPGGYIVNAYSPGGSCPAAIPITNTSVLTSGIAGADLTIAGFKMHITQASLNNDGSYKGTGYIVWHPFANDIELAVGFDTLKVNTDKVVYGGMATTAADLTATGSNYDLIQQRITDGLHLLNQGLGSAPVNFPLGLNTTLGGAPATLAIMGIRFMPACTNMNVLFDLNLPDLGGWLSLAGSGLQIDPNKVLQLDKGGILFLPQDHSLSLAGMNFKFDGCPSAGDNSVDVSKGTYVQWDGVNGLGNITVNADLQFTNANSIVAVDKNDKRLTDPATIHANFSFTDWNDWIASVIPTTNLELGSLPGFMISSTGGFYDHSTRQNASGMTFPPGYIGASDPTWQGLYIKDLTLQLPSSLSGTSAASFGFHNFLLDNSGVTTTISADNILTLATGNLGGWAFSVDHIGIGVVQDNFQSGMQMTGEIKLPISDVPLGYTCNLAAGEGTGLNYSFSVTPKGNYDVNMWAATIGLQSNSSLTITNKSGPFVINATLNGTVGLNASKVDKSLPNVTVTALSFQGMTLTNSDPKTNGFNFDPGNWSFGGKRLNSTAMNDLPNGTIAGGPSAQSDGPDTQNDGPSPSFFGQNEDPVPLPFSQNKTPAPFDDGGSQASADGFSLNFTGFKPYVKITPAEANIGVTFTMNAVLDESGMGIGGSATMDIFGTVDFPKGGTPMIVRPNINLDSIAINADLDVLKVSGSLAFKHNDPTFGDDVKGHLDLVFLSTVEVDAAAIFGHTVNPDGSYGYNYWGLAALAYWQQGIEFPPGLSLNGLGGGFHYNMAMGTSTLKTVTGSSDVSSPAAIINDLQPKAGTLGFDAQVVLAFLGPNVFCLEPTLAMDFSPSQGLEHVRFSGNAEILSSNPPQAGTGIINGTMVADLTTNPTNFNCTVAADIKQPPLQLNANVQFNLGALGDYLYVGTPAPPGTDFKDPAINSMVNVTVGFDEKIAYANLTVYGYFDIGNVLPSSPYIPPAIQNTQDHDGNSMAQGVVDKFTGMLQSLQMTNDASHDVHGTVNNPGFMLGAGIHFSAGLDLAVVSADGSLDIGFAAMLEHFDPSEVKACSADGKIGFNNWYAMAIFYADLSADLSVGPVTVASVNAGAVLSAGLISPSWASGDVWIDVSALGVLHFHGDVSINIGNPCSLVKDPLDNIDMIGDFGPRGKSGQSVDPSSLPYVIGNVPLDQDYPVVVNDGSSRVYRFKVDSYDVTDANGSPLGGASVQKISDYEEDVLHGQMLCGNANYNGHIRVSAYRTDAGDPNTPLVTQDTTFGFTTGPRPNTIMTDNIIYSWPIPQQRYLLKQEFGGQGRVAVTQDVSYLLHPGQPDECSATPPPPPAATKPSATPNTKPLLMTAIPSKTATTQLLAKFFPASGGDTLQTTFSYSYNVQDLTGILQFPLPALRNSTVYNLQIWVVPPPSAKNNAQVNTGSYTKTKTQTYTQYTMNDNHNLVATQVTKQVTDTNFSNTLSGARTMAATDSARVILAMQFGTSQYDKFADKMTAYGAWATGDEMTYQFNMPIYSTAAGAEPFDEFEINNFKSTCTSNGYKTPSIGHLFNADVPWDGTAHNDMEAAPLYLYSTALINYTHATVDLGFPETRSWFGIPMDSLVSLENMPFQPKLPDGKFGARFTSVTNASIYINNTAYETPANKDNTIYYQSPDKKTSLLTANYSSSLLPMTPGTPKPPPGLLWRRDNIFYNDHMLLSAFANDLATKSSQLYGQAVIDLLTYCPGCIVEQVNGYYGSISMTAESYAQASGGGGQTLIQDINNFVAQPFQLFPPTARRPINFTYSFPSPNPAQATGQYSSTFNYKSMPVFQSQVQITIQGGKAANQPTPTPAASPAPIILKNAVQAKTLLTTKYNLH
ncbi:MAG TPA: fibronectin type III domain-containing protein [Puia sp.]|jgi:hypothetical protein